MYGTEGSEAKRDRDSLAWLMYVFPRFRKYYQEEVWFVQSVEELYEEQYKPPSQTFCLINIPDMVWPVSH